MTLMMDTDNVFLDLLVETKKVRGKEDPVLLISSKCMTIKLIK